MATMTNFQINCEKALLDLLRRLGCIIGDREILQNEEVILHFSIKDHDVEFWIYDDEVEYRSGRRRRNFEAAVFKDDAQRISKFIEYASIDLI